jgi:hypothetical protein
MTALERYVLENNVGDFDDGLIGRRHSPSERAGGRGSMTRRPACGGHPRGSRTTRPASSEDRAAAF